MGGINRDIGLADPISGRVQHGSMGIFQVFIRSKEKMLLVFRHIYIYTYMHENVDGRPDSPLFSSSTASFWNDPNLM